MTASIFYPDHASTITIHTGALAVMLGAPAHASLGAGAAPADAKIAHGDLVTLYAQPTDIGGGNHAMLDDGSGPVGCYVDPARMPRVIRAMREREPVSIIARLEGNTLECVHLFDPRPPNPLLDVAHAQGTLALIAADETRKATAMDAEPDPDDALPGYREEVEWVTRRGGRSRHEERVRVRTTSEVDGERVEVERMRFVTLRHYAFRTPTPAWVPIDDPAERAALMAEAALRLYARDRRHERRREPESESQSALAKRAHAILDREGAIRIAKAAAKAHAGSHGYLADASSPDWMPHEWVIDAVLRGQRP